MARTRGGLASGASISARRLGKNFENTPVLSSVDLDIEPGGVVALLGPSGCGKTTLLRLLAGLLSPSSGTIAIGDEVVADASTGRLVPPERRSIGMVFQDYALWPHMTVAGNVAFPLEMKGVPAAERTQRVREALDLVGLGGLENRTPGMLSGGQQQRVALARAIVSRPSVILFDEPLSNLDRELRDQLVVDIAALIRSLGLTGVYVTHDHSEAFAIADEVAVMAGGRLVQIAPPEALVSQPFSAGVANFLKLGLVAPAQLASGKITFAEGDDVVETPTGFANGHAGSGELFIPRSALGIVAPDEGSFKGRVVRSTFRGDGYSTRIHLSCGLDLDLPNDGRLGDNMPVGVSVAWDSAAWFPAAQAGNDPT